MTTTNFILLATVAFVALIPTIMGSYIREYECQFKQYPSEYGRYGSRICPQCCNHVPCSCARNPFCPIKSETCLILVKQLRPLNATVPLCDLPLVKDLLGDLLNNLTIDSLCIDIYWEPLNCGVKTPTKVFISFVDCTLHIRIDNLDAGINCVSITIYSFLQKVTKLLDNTGSLLK